MPATDLSPYASTPPSGSHLASDGILAWRVQSTVTGLVRRADLARAAGNAADADSLLLSAWTAFEV